METGGERWLAQAYFLSGEPDLARENHSPKLFLGLRWIVRVGRRSGLDFGVGQLVESAPLLLRKSVLRAAFTTEIGFVHSDRVHKDWRSARK